jgi:hypothetical protein
MKAYRGSSIITPVFLNLGTTPLPPYPQIKHCHTVEGKVG